MTKLKVIAMLLNAWMSPTSASTINKPEEHDISDGESTSTTTEDNNRPAQAIPIHGDVTGEFGAFKNSREATLMIRGCFSATDSEYLDQNLELKQQLYEVMAVNIFNHCGNKNMNSQMSLKLEQLAHVDVYGFRSVDLSGFRFGFSPAAALKFLNDRCGMVELDMSMTKINIEELSNAKLDNLRVLKFLSNGLTQFPNLTNFTSLKMIDLSFNLLRHLNADSYEISPDSPKPLLPNLSYITIGFNNVNTIDFNITRLLPETSVIWLTDHVMICTPDILRSMANLNMIQLVNCPEGNTTSN